MRPGVATTTTTTSTTAAAATQRGGALSGDAMMRVTSVPIFIISRGTFEEWMLKRKEEEKGILVVVFRVT